MNWKRMLMISLSAVTLGAGFSGTASAHGRQGGDAHGEFHRHEQERERTQRERRAERARRLRAKFEAEKRSVLRVYGPRSREYDALLRRWARLNQTLIERERATFAEERRAKRQRHLAYHIEMRDDDRQPEDDIAGLFDLRIDPEWRVSGHAGHGHDHPYQQVGGYGDRDGHEHGPTCQHQQQQMATATR